MRYLDLLKLKEETFEYFTLEESLEAVKENGLNLAYVKHQTPEICLEAVKGQGNTLKYVINQTEEICIEAYRENPNSTVYIRIDIKDEELRKARDEWFKNYILKEPLKAVRESGFALQFVKYQTDEICKEALRQNGFALQFVINQTEEICLEAYEQEPNSIIFIRDSLEAYRKRRLNLILATF